jgi:glycosyltransferase involved in cell wall biosynthesis
MTARPLRILYVGTLPPHQGGSARSGFLVLTGLARLGHRVEAVSAITEAGLRTGDPLAGGDHGIDVTRFTLPYHDTSPDTPPSDEYRRLEGDQIGQLVTCLLERDQPDVVFIGRESFAEHVVPLARAHCLPSVLRIAGSTTVGIVNGSYPTPLAGRLLELFRQADAVVSPARHMQRTLGELGVPGVKVIPNPVEIDRFHPGPRSTGLREALGLGKDEVVVAHLSTLKALKRPLDIVDAAELAVRQDGRLAFVIVGDGHGRAVVEEACAGRGLADRFRFPGWVDYDRVPEFINSADMVVMPSAAEAQARVYLETQASERTLIASDIAAAREVVEDGETGLLFATGDASALAGRILMAARDPGLRAEIGRRARRGVAAAHALPDVAAAYADLLESVAAMARSRGPSSGARST